MLRLIKGPEAHVIVRLSEFDISQGRPVDFLFPLLVWWRPCGAPSRGVREEAMALTGRFNFRRSWFGKLMLELEEEFKPFFASEKKPVKRRWRRATLVDLAQPEMRALIDLRFQPQFLSRTSARPVEMPPTSMTDELPSMATPAPRANGASAQRTSH